MSIESNLGPVPGGPPEGRIRLDLGAQGRYLLGEWRMMLRPTNLASDAMSGIAVALVALPLSLAIANASGVAPGVGLVTAIVGGVAVALFGGCRLQVSGPAAAMTFLVYEIIAVWNRFGEEEGLGPNYGLTMIVAATLLAGVFQLLTGYFRIGRIMQFMPRPVVAGFLSGIGITILCTQLPKVLGYDVTHDEEGGAIGLLIETVRQLGQAEWRSVAIGLTAAGLMVGLPRVSTRLPTPLIAVAAATMLPIAFGWGPERIALIGDLPRAFPPPSLPAIPWEHWNELILAALTIYFLASIESLLSASVTGTMAKLPVDNDQELLGQGIGNVASACFAGIPVTGVIARSATNIQAGARTRGSAIIHALLILAMMLSLGPIVGRIPIAALAGVLLAVATRMIEVRMLGTLWHGNRAEAAVYLVTVLAIVTTDLIVGVPVGLIAAVFYVIYEMSKVELEPRPIVGPGVINGGGGAAEVAERCPAVVLLRVGGPMFFASGFHLRSMIARLGDYRCVVLDLADVSMLDFTAAELLEEAIEDLHAQGASVLLARPTPAVRRRLEGFTQRELEAVRGCEVVATLPEALRRAGGRIAPDRLCERCRPAGRCLVIEQALSDPDLVPAGSGPPIPEAVLARRGLEAAPVPD